MRFVWDVHKASANVRKHGVSFDEAKTIFEDTRMHLSVDVAHSDDEDRFIAIGLSDTPKLLAVFHCYRGDDVIRIFSARRATISETKLYR